MKIEDDRKRPRRDRFNEPTRHPKFYDERPRDDRREDRRPKPRRPRPPFDHMKQITTLFEDKREMIEYVNDKGQNGHHIEIFKIEEGLYKVVVNERKPKPSDSNLERI